MCLSYYNELKETIGEVIALVYFQPGYPNWHGINVLKLPKEPGAQPGITWCNNAAHEILDRMGYDDSMVLKPNKHNGEPDINWTSATDYVVNCYNASELGMHGIQELSGHQAQNEANHNMPIIVGSIRNQFNHASHVGVVCPGCWSKEMGPLIGQAGAKNGYFYAKIWTDEWKYDNVRYFRFNKVR